MKTKLSKAEVTEELDAIKMVAKEIMADMPRCPVGFNHGFLWCYATLANGKSYKMLIGSHCPASWLDVEEAVRNGVKEITTTYVNMD